MTLGLSWPSFSLPIFTVTTQTKLLLLCISEAWQACPDLFYYPRCPGPGSISFIATSSIFCPSEWVALFNPLFCLSCLSRETELSGEALMTFHHLTSICSGHCGPQHPRFRLQGHFSYRLIYISLHKTLRKSHRM